jgi:hypothetical protein
MARVPAMLTEELNNLILVLQPRHIDIEVHPVDALDRNLDMIAYDLGDTWCYHLSGFVVARLCLL